MSSYKIYLAGPEVFLPDFGKPVLDAKKAVCAAAGFEGVSPMDAAPELAGLGPFAQGLAIYGGLVPQMRACDAVIANMTPFRGVSMDVGTAFEMGFMAAQGKPVLGYSHAPVCFEDRSAGYYAHACPSLERYSAGTMIERFDMADNLMMVGAVAAAGFKVELVGVPPGEELTSLAGFRLGVAALAKLLRATSAAS